MLCSVRYANILWSAHTAHGRYIETTNSEENMVQARSEHTDELASSVLDHAQDTSKCVSLLNTNKSQIPFSSMGLVKRTIFEGNWLEALKLFDSLSDTFTSPVDKKN